MRRRNTNRRRKFSAPHSNQPRTRFGVRGFETLETRIQPAALPMISEVMASNDTVLDDEDGDSTDWIEIYNAGDADLDLGGWHLTDDAADLQKWTIPATTVGPGDFLLVYASDKNRADADGTELHTNFKLSSSGDYLALVENDGTSVAFEYAPTIPELDTDVSYGISMASNTTTLVDDTTALTYHIPTSGTLGTTWTAAGFNDSTWNGANGPTLTAGIGYENSPADYDSFIDTAIPTGTATFYSRFDFAVANPSDIDTLNLGVMYDDDFVAYLNGVKIAASPDAPANPQWNSTSGQQRPDGTVIEDFVRFDVSQHADLLQPGNNVLAIHGINTSSGSSDMLMIPELIASQSGIQTPLTFGFFSDPTPGSGNGQSFDGFVQDTSFSIDRGFYSSPFDVEITTLTEDATIVYTLDGSDPTVNASLNVTNGQLYTGPVNISETVALRAVAFKDGFEPTNIDTQTYIFAADVIDQDFQHALDLGMPSNWGSNAADYGINVPNEHRADFTAALTGIPTISLVLDADELFASDGIYTNSTSRGQSWERPVSMELIYPDGEVGFQEDAGLRIQGGAFRNYGLTAKNSFRLAFRGEYGDTKLNYPLFGDGGPEEFDNLILRMESNDGWQWAGGDPKLFARDEFGRRTQLAMGHPSPAGTRMHVYINGHYWGMYNPVERPDEGFAETHYGGDKDDYDVIKSGEIQEGSSAAWNALNNIARDVRAAGTEADRTAAYMESLGRNPDGTRNESLPVYLDDVNYVDYLITNFYGGNSDWPHKNYAMVRDRTDASEGFKFIMWDSEWSLGMRSNVSTNRLNESSGIAEPYSNLKSSEEFQVLFGDRIHKHMFNDGVLTPENARERLDEVLAEVEPGIWGESGRWGDQHRNTPFVPDVDWVNEINSIRSTYLPQRTNNVINQFRAAGLYPSVTAVSWNQRGGTVSQNFGVSLSAPTGTIYYTTDGSDPRELGGGISANAIRYTSAFTLPVATTINARVLSGSEWSALDVAEFESSVPTNEELYLRVTEVHYHPATPDAVEQAAGFLDDNQFEFLEIANTSPDTTIDLANVRFSEGITVAFPSGSQPLAPGEHVLLVSDVDAFTFRYGAGVVNGATQLLSYTGQLNNGGEQLQVLDGFGNVIQDFVYNDADPWPVEADGDGSSLEVISTSGDYSSSDNWRASLVVGGTPGGTDIPIALDCDYIGGLDGCDLDDLDVLYSNGGGSQGLITFVSSGIQATVGGTAVPINPDAVVENGALAGGYTFQLTVDTPTDLLIIDAALTVNSGNYHNEPAPANDTAPPLESLLDLFPTLSADSWITTPGSTVLAGANSLDAAGTEVSHFDLSDEGAQIGFQFGQITLLPNASGVASATVTGEIRTSSTPTPVVDTYSFTLTIAAPNSRFDYDGNGVVDAADIPGWLADASDLENPANPNGHTYVIGDVNLDGTVNSTDLGLLLNNFGANAPSAGVGVGWRGGDLDMNGTVNSTDLGLLLNQFGFESVSANVASAYRIPRAAHPAAPATMVTDDANSKQMQFEQVEQVDSSEATAQFSYSPKTESIAHRPIDYRPIDFVFGLDADDEE